MQLEGMAYPITPIGMHYLLIYYDIPMLDDHADRLQVDGLVKTRSPWTWTASAAC